MLGMVLPERLCVLPLPRLFISQFRVAESALLEHCESLEKERGCLEVPFLCRKESVIFW